MDSTYNLHDRSPLREIADYPRMAEFIRSLSDDVQLASFTFPVPAFDPLACLEIQQDQPGFQYYWELPDQQFALSAGGRVRRITAGGSTRFRDIAGAIDELKGQSREFSTMEHSLSGIHLLGGFSFDGSTGDPCWNPFQPASFTIPEWLLVRDGKLGLLTLTLNPASYDHDEAIREHLEQRIRYFYRIFRLDEGTILDAPPENAPVHVQSMDAPDRRRHWIEKVNKAKHHIREGRFKKIVLTRKREMELPSPPAPTVMLHHLRTRYPSCFSFLVRPGRNRAFLGCSPEQLVSFRNSYLLTEGLAGSINRGHTSSEDSRFEQRLLNSRKDRTEHQFVVDAITQRLQPFATRIDKSDRTTVRKLHNVQHLLTPITAWLKDNSDRLEILEQLHPTPAVGGYPREEALACLSELEPFSRGWYAGPVGWLNLKGGGTFTVAIRSGLLHDNRINLYAGCGIVEDSDPESEWNETNLKFSPMISALHYAGIDARE